MEVVEGPPDLLGPDMALSAWYDEMKRDFAPSPIILPGIVLDEGEMAYLTANEVAFAPAPPLTLSMSGGMAITRLAKYSASTSWAPGAIWTVVASY